jgi:hypothetical protein
LQEKIIQAQREARQGADVIGRYRADLRPREGATRRDYEKSGYNTLFRCHADGIAHGEATAAVSKLEIISAFFLQE